MLRRAFEICGGFKLYKGKAYHQVDRKKDEPEPSPVMTEIHKRATRRLVLCFDGVFSISNVADDV